jgi:prolyl 4-hydroxylase
MGWRGNHTRLQPLKVQRYGPGGFYTFHYDWDALVEDGNRATTFMIYLVANCTGGGTNFPKLPMPEDARWCSVIECGEGRDGYEGVTFKPVTGSAVYWENIHPNGTLHLGVRHASLPVKEGVKVGLNIWSWDDAWRKPEEV